MPERIKSPLFWFSILSGVKLLSDALLGVKIPDETINAVANGIAGIVSLVGIYATWAQKQKDE